LQLLAAHGAVLKDWVHVKFKQVSVVHRLVSVQATSLVQHWPPAQQVKLLQYADWHCVAVVQKPPSGFFGRHAPPWQ
jgi:hypothetical protein